LKAPSQTQRISIVKEKTADIATLSARHTPAFETESGLRWALLGLNKSATSPIVRNSCKYPACILAQGLQNIIKLTGCFIGAGVFGQFNPHPLGGNPAA
jgi:hypothetical protein